MEKIMEVLFETCCSIPEGYHKRKNVQLQEQKVEVKEVDTYE